MPPIFAQFVRHREGTIRDYKKMVNNESVKDSCGKHQNHMFRLTEDVRKMIDEHCMSIPHSQSHYKSEKSDLKYFDHPDLTLTKLYTLLLEFYTTKTSLENLRSINIHTGSILITI